ncbi:TniQ family protein [Mesobacillus jeotgali]|uniref:TniQ family protein n=1 Tax=Mesobacillus jeotgali TaxID=129985 RepID=UPI0015915FA6|nr:TniQ family protein [Mesobacillus jeotgali]
MFKDDNINERNVLYNLEPIGVGTDQIESLTSYIARLSKEHNIKVSKLFNNLIFPVFKEGNITGATGKGWSKRSSSINGNGKSNNGLTKVLILFTGRKDLELLSLNLFSNLINNGKELKLKKAWCPSCLRQHERNMEPIYERLIWNFEHVEICPIHHCFLETKCPNSNCRRELPVLSGEVPLGICHWCKCKLSTAIPRGRLGRKRQVQTLIIKEIGSLLVLNREQRKNLNQVQTAALIQDIFVKVKINFGINDGLFTNYVGVSSNTVCGWKKGQVPALITLIKLSYCINSNLIDLFFKKISIDNIRRFPFYFLTQIRPRNRRLVRKHIKMNLAKIMNSPYFGKFSLEETAKKIGYKNGATLKDQFPLESKKIISAHKEFKRKKFENKIEVLKHRMKESIIELLASGIEPTRYRVIQKLSLSFFREEYNDLYDKVYKELLNKDTPNNEQ